LKPDEALSSWREWRCALRSRPIIVTQLTGGKTNQSFLLESDGRKLAMRLNSPAVALPGVDRANEARIWQAASNAGLAPAVLHIDTQSGLLVTEYIDGASLDASEIDDPLIDRLVRLLADVHELDINVPVLDYAAHIENFWQLIESRPHRENMRLLQRREPLQQLVEEFMASVTHIGLCHHDPARSNVVRRDNKLYLLDWEYAARGPVEMDFAALSVEWDIDTAKICNRTELEPVLLETAKTIYLYICALWSEVRA
jgi:thiamine kinase-like enzyme